MVLNKLFKSFASVIKGDSIYLKIFIILIILLMKVICFCEVFWCVPQERSIKCILHHFQFASFAFCDLIRISDYKMHQCIQSLMHVAVHTLEDHLLDFAKCGKTNLTRFFLQSKLYPFKISIFPFFLIFNTFRGHLQKSNIINIFSDPGGFQWLSKAVQACIPVSKPGPMQIKHPKHRKTNCGTQYTAQ